jgi:hypothetical protein
MLLTKPQLSRFWRDWSRVIKYQDWSHDQAETERKALLQRAGFQSLTHVDRSAGFDRLLSELGRLLDNVKRTAELGNPEPGERRRYLHLIREHAAQLGGEPYVLALARDRFHVTTGLNTIQDLSTQDLYQLMMTLAARASSARRARENQSLTSEETFPDQVAFEPAMAGDPDNQPF